MVGDRGVIQHCDASACSTWSRGVTDNLLALCGTGDCDVWAVGSGSQALRWNGSEWITIDVGAPLTLRAVWSSGPENAWAVGPGGTIMHWNGSAWSRSESPTAKDLDGVWGSGPSDVWAVGGGVWVNHALVDPSGVILHWNGSSWSSEPIDTRILYGIFGSGADDVWTYGSDGIAYGGVAWHWDGTSWIDVSASLPSGARLIAGTGANDLWAVVGGTKVFRWDGMSWSEKFVLQFAGGPAWARGTNDLWGCGGTATGMIQRCWHWDGLTWSYLPNDPIDLAFHAIFVDRSGRVLVAGQNGLLLSYRP
jgi:hypothetical protein